MIRIVLVLLLLLPSFASAACQTAWDYEEYHLSTWIGNGCGAYGMIEDWIAANPGGGYSGYQCGLHTNGNYVYGLWSVTWIYPTTDTDCDGIGDGDDLCADSVGTVGADGCPLEPATCLDGVVSGSETGIDCGDPACTGDETCTTYCPAGFVSEVRQGLEYCYSADDTPDYTVDAKLGVCPSNLFVSSTDPTKCVSSALPTWASGDYLDPVETDPADTTPWNNVFTDENTTFTTEQYNTAGVITDVSIASTTGTTSTGQEVSNTETTTTVTELDGSKVETTVADSTNRDSSGVVTGTTTTTVRTYDPGGTLTGETSQVEQVGSTEDAGSPFVAPGDGETYVLDEEKAGQFATRYTDFSTAVTGAPVFAPIASLFDGPDTSGKTSVFTMSMGSYGSQSLDLTNYDSAFSVLGKIFVFLSLLAAGRLVFINRGS